MKEDFVTYKQVLLVGIPYCMKILDKTKFNKERG